MHLPAIKEKQAKMIYAIGTIEENIDESLKGNLQSASSVTKRHFKLFIGDVNQHLTQQPLSLAPIQQEKSKTGHYQAAFAIKKQAAIKKQEIMINFPINCIVNGNKMTIPEEEIRKMMADFKRLCQQDQSEQSENSYHSDKSDRVQGNRGRGRPKGSKNKKKDCVGEESSDESYEHSDYKKQQKKPGKGRPKGSKNKKKDIYDEISNQSNFHTLFKKLFHHRSYDEINKKLNKDSNLKKDEAVVKVEENNEDNNNKRSRGRPKGVKNKKNKAEEEGDSEQNFTIQPIPERPLFTNTSKCCSKCTQRQNKIAYLQGKLRDISSLRNVAQNIGVQDTTNLIIHAIRNNQQSSLKELLQLVDKVQNDFLVPWDCGNRLQNAGYTIRTRKDYLIRNQKQMINALLQDRYTYRGKWWQIVGIERIMENLPHYEEGVQVYKILVEAAPEFEELFYQNIPSLLRNGNENISRYLIEKVMSMKENSTIYGYSKDHFECLNKKRTEIQFKKSTMLKQNCTSNFCSPIHCAVINSNTDLLSHILKHISQFNVGDSLNRKPIHYAAALESTKALQILYKHNSQQLTQMDKRKMTPLMIAAQLGRYNVSKFILEKIRDKEYINHKSDEGLTALHYATINKHQQCLALLLNDPLVNENQETKQRFSILHLAAGGGDKQIVKMILSKNVKNSWDNFRRSPLVIALRNHHNDIFFQLLKEAQCNFKRDYSNNTLLHYAAAYGNVELIMYLSKIIDQIPNKKNFYPWELAVLKGHFYCAQMLEIRENKVINFPQNHHLIFLLLKNPRGTKQFMAMVKYLIKANIYQLNYQYNGGGDSCLHLVCSISEKEYYSQRQRESSEIGRNQYEEMERTLIHILLDNGADPEIVNERGQKAVNLCIENQNIVGIQLLLNQIPFDIQPQTKNNHFVYYMTNIACRGKKQILFVHKKLAEVDEKILKTELRKTDCHGFEFLIFLMKNFTQTVHSNFRKNYISFLEQHPLRERNSIETKRKCVEQAYLEYVEHENNLLKLVNFLIEKGSDPRSVVVEPKVERENENYKKWGIQHFLMRFPSLVLLKTFMKWIDKNFNMQNSEGRTPLHLFCMWNKEGFLFNTDQIEMDPVPFIDDHYQISDDYEGQKCLDYLLENGLTSNILDINRSTPLLYAALNGQFNFMNLLRIYGSSINNCNLLNQVPLIQIIKSKDKFTMKQIESILGENGATVDIRDLYQRNALHHLVSNAKNFDTSPEICKKLLDYGVKINSLDKFGRSPIFYCFIKIKGGDDENSFEQVDNDKVEILQTLLNCDEIDLSIVDIYKKSPLHYACEKKFFFSILYLLDTSMNYDTKDAEGNTPLGICLKHRMLNQATLLIRKGVKYGTVIDNGHCYSYFQYAVNKQLSVGICFLLLDHGYPLQRALEQVSNEAFQNQLRKKYVQGA